MFISKNLGDAGRAARWRRGASLAAAAAALLLNHHAARAAEDAGDAPPENHAQDAHQHGGHEHDDHALSVRFGPFTLTPMISADSVLYTDSEGGDGDGYYSNALGIFNVHSHEGGGGHDHGHSHNLEQGFNFRGVELGLGLQIDDLARGRLLMHGAEDHAEIEEAWLATHGLPFGFEVKGGRFRSAFTTENERHAHDWDFVAAPLAYRMLLDGELIGDGAQVSWSRKIAPRVSLHLGAELFDTDNEAIAGRIEAEDIAAIESHAASLMDPESATWNSDPAWPDVWTVFGRASVDLAPRHQLTLGAALIDSRLHQELHEYHPGVNEANHGLEGTTRTATLSAGYQRRSGAPEGDGDFRLYGEYFYQEKPIRLTYHELQPALVGQPRDLEVDGYYVAALYGVAPGWTLGARYDSAGALHQASRAAATLGPTHISVFDELWRVTGNVTWDVNQHHRLRLEASHGEVQTPIDTDGDGRDEAVDKAVSAVMLQYVLKFGGHSH